MSSSSPSYIIAVSAITVGGIAFVTAVIVSIVWAVWVHDHRDNHVEQEDIPVTPEFADSTRLLVSTTVPSSHTTISGVNITGDFTPLTDSFSNTTLIKTGDYIEFVGYYTIGSGSPQNLGIRIEDNIATSIYSNEVQALDDNKIHMIMKLHRINDSEAFVALRVTSTDTDGLIAHFFDSVPLDWSVSATFTITPMITGEFPAQAVNVTSTQHITTLTRLHTT
jgi:hypothetical protein